MVISEAAIIFLEIGDWDKFIFLVKLCKMYIYIICIFVYRIDIKSKNFSLN